MLLHGLTPAVIRGATGRQRETAFCEPALILADPPDGTQVSVTGRTVMGPLTGGQPLDLFRLAL